MPTQQSVFDFLSVSSSFKSINKTRLEEIRSSHHVFLSQTGTSATPTSEQVLRHLVAQYNLLDDATNIDHLKLCLQNPTNLDLTCHELVSAFNRMQFTGNSEKRRQALPSNSTREQSTSSKSTVVESVKEVVCRIDVKQDQPAVHEFIHKFLFQPLTESRVFRRDRYTTSMASNQLPPIAGCALDVFIREQLRARGTIDAGRSLRKLQLAEPITIDDEFDTWYFDHMRGVMQLWLVNNDAPAFPTRWKLDPNANISYVIEIDDIRKNADDDNDDDNESSKTMVNVDRPRTISLEHFVHDVCEKENNGKYEKWISALRDDDVSTYAHLAGLKHTEWTELKLLSMNGRKILKSYVNREKQMAAEIKTTKKKNNETERTNTTTSELLARLHQIKLYFHYVLNDQFSRAGITHPAKLDKRCVELSFEEMRSEGFADDGLFDQMKVFFLPLTIIEQDLRIDDDRWAQFASTRLEEQMTLRQRHEELLGKLVEVEDEYYQHDDAISRLRRELWATAPRRTRKVPDEEESFSVPQLIEEHQLGMERLEPRRTELRAEINTIEGMIASIEQGLSDRITNLDRNLIKPNRGFIMYGPPGTGKSDIMSKLSIRIGINMVAPPLAAGELNRSLVGESERIINDICMRCHQTPHLMCCVSIDEIDSLAPKRTDEAKEVSVAKLSVLLSVIDGIKDVPNLMIFCATNRLHMMDEAFLRRMSGKFFVGRPSSQARKKILSGIKPWHLTPSILDKLTMATTNFSGAALSALRRLITVHCIDAEEGDPKYQLDYRTTLQLCHTVAQQFRITIGSENLPTILLRNITQQQEIGYQRQYHYADFPNKRNSVYTGKVLVNLSAKRIEVEAELTDAAGSGEREKIVYLEHLNDDETDVQQLLERLTTYGKSRNVQLFQVIDLSLLSNESAYDEKQRFEILKDRLDEYVAYRRSMIVYDLDSLVGVNKSESVSSMGLSTSQSLSNQNLYIFVKENFQLAHIEPTLSSDDPTQAEEKWSIVVIRDPFLCRQFCDDVQFTLSVGEIQQRAADRAEAEQTLRCVQCNDFYSEEDNKVGQCVHHDGFVYDNYSNTLTQWSPERAIEQLLVEEAEAAQQANIGNSPLTNEQKERAERAKQRFRYICCNQMLQTSGNANGCKKGKHGPQNITRNEWELARDNNQEYHEKRRRLLHTRAEQHH